MRKKEFLEALATELRSEMSENDVHSQVEFYDQYIRDEVKKGRTEQEVLEELGDPWVIARNLEESIEYTDANYTESSEMHNHHADSDSQNKQNYTGNVFSVNGSKIGCFIILLIILVVLYFFVGIVRILAPILIPVLIVLYIYRTFIKK